MGLVDVMEDPSDRREKRVHLTTAGKAARERAEGNVRTALRRAPNTAA